MGYTRLLSPNRRRLPTLDDSDVKDKVTIANLLHAGWKPYKGPAKVDARGWLIDGSDPDIKAPEKGYAS